MKSKILVVEDEAIIAYDIKGILETNYHVIINIKTVEEAITIIEIEKPDLVLIDIQLRADKEGTDLGEYLIKKDVIPFIYITSLTDRMTLEKVKNTRPYGYIVKPFKTEDLETTVFLALNTFKYRKIDNLRSENEILNDIPFRIKETINYINQNLHDKIDIETLAEITNWKTHHYIRVFTRYMGVTPYQYILTRKIEKSKVLLLDKSISVSSIAFDLGFQSYSNYINAFKKIIGSTPESYRNFEILKKKRIS
jgi:AraC-like DNA-binding protein